MIRLLRIAAALVVVGLAVVVPPACCTMWQSAGHLYTTGSAPSADVVIVFGAQVAPGGQRPMPFLAGRLDTAAQLLRDGTARMLLISGDSAGGSGDETRVMRAYLLERGVDERRIVTDPHGLDTYDTCRRARDVYGVQRALLVSQAFHLRRAVTLCRGLGVDVDGVAARCDGCRKRTLALNRLRELATGPKAIWDATSDRPSAVASPPDASLRAP